MGTSVLLAPFIIPLIIFAFFEIILNPSEFIGIFTNVFTEETLEEFFNYFLSGEFSKNAMEGFAEYIQFLSEHFASIK